MIDWVETKNKYGYDEDMVSTMSRFSVVVVCDKCGCRKVWAIRKRSEWNDGQINYVCIKCRYSDPAYKQKQSEAGKKLWLEKRDKMMATKCSALYKENMSKSIKKKWTDNQFRERVTVANIRAHNTAEYREQASSIAKQLWQNPDYRIAVSRASARKWQDKEYRERALKFLRSDEHRQAVASMFQRLWKDPKYKEKMAMALAKHPKVSSIQKILYSILDDLGVKYYREYEKGGAGRTDPECQIGPHSFDCMIPRENRPDLLIECQGDYWHSLDGRVWRDQAKATYIANNLSDQYELKCIWEHEFLNKNKIIELLKYWLGITQLELIDFNFNDVKIQDCAAQDYKLLLSKYHYIPAGRGGMAHGSLGAYLADELIAVCIFSPLARQNLPWPKDSSRELSRLCIHPRYQKKNFASWFVSRCIKQLDDKFKIIISYCDTTFNHDGAVYKACNFELDGEVRPDYWYVGEDGWVMHKKTLYNHARQINMKEKDYAAKHGYMKIYGKKKLRFIYRR